MFEFEFLSSRNPLVFLIIFPLLIYLFILMSRWFSTGYIYFKYGVLKSRFNPEFKFHKILNGTVFPYASCELKGRRPYMEDRLKIIPNLFNFNNNFRDLEKFKFADEEKIGKMERMEKISMFSVFDGHGGSEAAEFCVNNIEKVLESSINGNEEVKIKENNVGKGFWIKDVLMNAFQTLDEKFLEIAHRRSLDDGTTALCAVITEDSLTIANTGDSRAVLITSTTQNYKPEIVAESKSMEAVEKTSIKYFTPGINGKNSNLYVNGNADSSVENNYTRYNGNTLEEEVNIFSDDNSSFSKSRNGRSEKPRIEYRPEALSVDHKPDLFAERRRITELGGSVIHWGVWRVEGVLAVSRAIGDRQLKKLVPAKPDVTQRPLTVTSLSDSKEEALVLGTDGLWDVLSNAEVAEIVGRGLSAYEGSANGLTRVAEELAKTALGRGSMDNITVIVIDLNKSRRESYKTLSDSDYNSEESESGSEVVHIKSY